MCFRKKLNKAALVLFVLAASTAPAIAVEKLDVVVPEQIAEGGIIPIIIQVAGYDLDPVKSIVVSLENNPSPFNLAFAVELANPVAEFLTSTRVRSGSTGPLKGTIVLKQQSGKSTTKFFEKGNVAKPVDFSKPETLTVIFKGSFVFPTDEIGQPQKISRPKKDQSRVIDIRGLLHHPMLPPSAADPTGHYVNQVEVVADGVVLATVKTTAVLSNSPYFQLELPTNADPNSVKLVWKDTKGYSFSK